MNATPIESYLDELLRRAHADPRTIRRLLDETNDHLLAAADELEAAGLSRIDAEREAVRRCAPVTWLLSGPWRRAFGATVLETGRAARLLGGFALVAIGLSGGVAAVMNAVAGNGFVGGATVLGSGGHSIAETAQDAVSLRVLAGVVGLVVLAGYLLLRRFLRPAVVLPDGLVDALGAAAFAAATVVLVGASGGQAVRGAGGAGVGFFLSGAIISLVGAVLFCIRATRALLPHR
jgi:hypothetical protein